MCGSNQRPLVIAGSDDRLPRHADALFDLRADGDPAADQLHRQGLCDPRHRWTIAWIEFERPARQANRLGHPLFRPLVRLCSGARK